MILDASTTNDVLYTKVMIDDVIYNYYQTQSVIIITEKDLGKMIHKSNVIPIKNHLAFIDIAKNDDIDFFIKVNNIIITDKEYEFVDMTRNLKLKKIKNKLLFKS